MQNHSSVYKELRVRNWERNYGQKILIAAVTLAILFPIACLTYNHFYPVKALHQFHQDAFLAEINNQ